MEDYSLLAGMAAVIDNLDMLEGAPD